MQKKQVPSPDLVLSAGLRRYLYLTAAVTGAAILIVEILGAKMLSPYVGTSHFVWTAQIAVTLLSLAVGYYFGGWLVDRSPKLSRLYTCILLAAVYLCLSVLVCEPVAYWCLRFKLAVGALLASAFLFFVPLTLLATTGPFLIRVLTQSVSAVGGQVGRLSAISTLGSVAGTVLIGYLLIPFFPNSFTMFMTATLLLLVAVGHFLIWGNRSGPKRAAVVAVLAGLALGYGGIWRESHVRLPDWDELAKVNSNFGLMQVLERKGYNLRYYLNDYLTQNTYDPVQKKSTALFTYMLHGLARAYTPRIEQALCIGLGVGIVPMQFATEGVKVDVVEINPAVVPLATRHFNLHPERLNIFIGDGRYFINRAEKKYDTIILDAFLGDSSPSHLLTREAFGAMRRILKPGGTLVINSFGELRRGEDFFTASLAKTLKSVFRDFRIHADGHGNVFFVASDQADLQIINSVSLDDVHEHVVERVKNAFAGVIQANPDHGRVLTDDYNPVEFYDAANREYLRRQLAMSMRGQ